MACEIESGVPMPDSVSRTRRGKYKFDKMGVEDSFSVPYGIKHPQNIAARASAKFKPKKFKAGPDPKSANGGSRIWRTE